MALYPVVSRLALASTLVATLLFATACSQPTPEERFEMALEKVMVQRPPDHLGATMILRDLVRQEDASREIRLNAHLMLAQIYQNVGDLENAEQFTKAAVDLFGLDSEEGQTAQEALLNVLTAKQDPAAALVLVRELLAREDLPTPRRTRLRLREASLLLVTGEEDLGREMFHQMALEFEDAQLEQLALDSVVRSYMPDNPRDAASAYLRFATEKPESPLAPKARFGAGVYYLQAEDTELGTPLVEEFIEREQAEIQEILNSDERSSRRLGLARAFQMLGRGEEERAVLRLILEENKGNEQAAMAVYQFLVGSFLNELNFDAALGVLTEVQDTFPGTEAAQAAARFAGNVQSAKLEYERQMAEVEAQMGNAETAGDTPEPAAEAVTEAEAQPTAEPAEEAAAELAPAEATETAEAVVTDEAQPATAPEAVEAAPAPAEPAEVTP